MQGQRLGAQESALPEKQVVGSCRLRVAKQGAAASTEQPLLGNYGFEHTAVISNIPHAIILKQDASSGFVDEVERG